MTTRFEIKKLLVVTALALGLGACEMLVDGQASPSAIEPARPGFDKERLSRVNFLQCYSEELVINIDLRNEDLSREPRFPSATGELTVKRGDMASSFDRLSLGYAESSYFYRKSGPTDDAQYTLQLSFERYASSFDFEIHFVSEDYVYGEAKLVLHDGGRTRTMKDALNCYVN